MPDTYRWTTPILLTDGHRLFPSEQDPFKMIAIADDSGREPQDTDNGLLWLNFAFPLRIIKNVDEVFLIPVTDDNGVEFRTCTDASSMLYLSATFNWPIVDQRNDNAVYKVEER